MVRSAGVLNFVLGYWPGVLQKGYLKLDLFYSPKELRNRKDDRKVIG